jgi:hypothetical protein
VIATQSSPQADANVSVVPLDDDLDYFFEELRGFGPGIDMILDGLKWIALRAHTAHTTNNHIAVLGGNCPSVTNLIAEVIARLGDPAQNPGLRDLSADRQDTVRRLTRQYLACDETFPLHDIASDACAVIEGH